MQPAKPISPSDPTPRTPSGRFSSLFRGRRVSAEPKISEKMGALTISEDVEIVSPRLSKTYGRAHTVHVDMILSLLDSTQAGAQFVKVLHEKFSTLISKDVKSLKSAACDLWRSVSKVRIIENNKMVLDFHPEAYNDLAEEDVPDLNFRFLKLMNRFPRVMLPEHVDWKNMEDVASWVEESLTLDVTHPLARFLRSWSQDRYNGLLVNEVVTGFGYVPDSDPPPPIIAELQQKQKMHICTFLEDGTHTETLIMPIRILDREERTTLESLTWTLIFKYDASYMLQGISSHATQQKKIKQ